MYKRIWKILIAICILIPFMPAMAEELTDPFIIMEEGKEDEVIGVASDLPAEDKNANFANLVIFVEFNDTTHNHTTEYYCSRNWQLAFEWFDGDGRNGSVSNARSLKRYMDQISYGNMKIANIFPQFNGSEIVPFQLPQNTKYYADHESEMIEEVIKRLADYKGVNLDLWEADGCLDNLAIVVPYLGQEGQTDFIAHHAVYGSADKISGSLVRSYTLLPEGTVYVGIGGSGTVIHEFLHVLDYPDLYRSRGEEKQPVGLWDIMAKASARVQYPLAYLRSHISGWFSIPTITQSTVGYSLYAATTATKATKDNQAVILKTNYSDTEFFVLEYRKKGNAYNSTGYSDELECSIPGSGLIIYRVNTVHDTNVMGPPDMVYLFRPGDDYGSDGYEQGKTDGLSESYLSEESGRTFYGSDDFEKGLSDGAITYSDGTNSGIVISNVGSAEGDLITFDITFADSDDYWITISEEQDNSDTSMEIASYMDTDGTLYYLQKKDNNRVYLYSYNSGWNRMGEAPGGWYHNLTKFNGSIYATYLDTNFYVKLACWNGSGWQEVPIGTYQASEICMTSGRNGIYLSWKDFNSDKMYACEYTGSRTSMLGEMVGNENGANPSISEENGKIVVTYRLWMQDNRLCTKRYDRAANSWRDISGDGYKGSGINRINGNKIYLLESSTALSVYTYDLEKDNGVWEKLGNSINLNGGSTEMNICFQGEHPYIVFMEGSGNECRTNVMYLADGQWHRLGSQVASGYIQGIDIYSKDGEIWVTYCSMSGSKKVYIKTHSSGRKPVPTPEPTPAPTILPTPAITPTPRPVLPDGWPFYDVSVVPGHWKYESVKYVYENGIMNGITNSDGTINTFEPDEALTRAMFATVLYRIEGSPAIRFENRFSDVVSGRYYSSAIIWAYQKGIVNGYADGSFGVDDNITREQIAKMLKYYSDLKGYTTNTLVDINNFPDAAEVSGWAVDPIRWAVGSGMMNGKNIGGTYYLDPKGEATRAECAAMLTRFMKSYR